MQIFKLDDTYTVVCETKNTRNGFKHEATLLNNYNDVAFAKACYLNRTWERFQYETVIRQVLTKYFGQEQAKKYLEEIRNV